MRRTKTTPDRSQRLPDKPARHWLGSRNRSPHSTEHVDREGASWWPIGHGNIQPKIVVFAPWSFPWQNLSNYQNGKNENIEFSTHSKRKFLRSYGHVTRYTSADLRALSKTEKTASISEPSGEFWAPKILGERPRLPYSASDRSCTSDS